MTDFQSKPSTVTKRRLSGFGGTTAVGSAPRHPQAQLTPMYAGIAANILSDGLSVEVGISIHDGSYTIDYCTDKIKLTQHPTKAPGVVENYVIKALMQFSTDHLLKFVACGLSQFLADLAPNLCNRLWLELDMVPMVRVHFVQLITPRLPRTPPALPRPHHRQAVASRSAALARGHYARRAQGSAQGRVSPQVSYRDSQGYDHWGDLSPSR